QGGHVESGDTIHDMIRFIDVPVRMVGTGWVASAGALIYVAVPKEQRYSLPNTRYLLHQPWGGARGSAADIEIEAREIGKMRERLNRVFAEQTGQPLEKIVDDTRRNFWLAGDAAVDYGLVGSIIRSASRRHSEAGDAARESQRRAFPHPPDVDDPRPRPALRERALRPRAGARNQWRSHPGDRAGRASGPRRTAAPASCTHAGVRQRALACVPAPDPRAHPVASRRRPQRGLLELARGDVSGRADAVA